MIVADRIMFQVHTRIFSLLKSRNFFINSKHSIIQPLNLVVKESAVQYIIQPVYTNNKLSVAVIYLFPLNMCYFTYK